MEEVKAEETRTDGDLNHEEDANSVELDTHSYLQLNEFSSERFKVELKGLPKIHGHGELKSFLTKKMSIFPHKINIVGRNKGVFIAFKNTKERDNAISVLNKSKWKGKQIKALVARAAQDPYIVAKKKALNDDATVAEGLNKNILERNNPEQELPVKERIKNSTIPWADYPYTKQLELKNKEVQESTQKMISDIKKINFEESRNLKIQIEEIHPSQVSEGYRNKCEFTIGYDPDSNEKTVGFRLNRYRSGSVAVGPIDDLLHIPKCMKQAAFIVQDFIRASKLEPFEPESYKGCFKILTIRTNQLQEVLMILEVNDRHLLSEELASLKLELKDKFSKITHPKIISFYLKVLEKSGQQIKNVPELLFGVKFILETIDQYKFRISPEAFFQVNTKAAEDLYSTLREIAEIDENTSVLDICCGTGTIGICLSKYCGEVFGIELVPTATKDAQENADSNGLEKGKCEFFCGKAEDYLECLINRCKYSKIVAVVDPPRAGLHQKVIQTIRRCNKIKRIVYVACDIRASIRSFCDFARPTSKAYKLAPFLPKKFVPIDLFPHTPHFELVATLERS